MMAFADIEDKTSSLELIVFPKTYEQYGQLVTAGNILIVKGRAKGDRDEGIQVTCESIMTPDTVNDYIIAGLLKTEQPDRKYESAAPPQNPPPQTAKAKRPGLYLKFPNENSPQIEQARVVLSIFEGDFPVYFYYVDEKKLVQCPSSYRIDNPNDVMTGELKRILGGENVAVVQDTQTI